MKGFTQLKFTMSIVAALLMLVFSVSAQQSNRARTEITATAKAQDGAQVQSNSSTGSQLRAQVDFSAPLSVANAIQIAQQQNVTIVQIQHSFMIGKQRFTGFFPIGAGTNAASIESELLAKYREFLLDFAQQGNEVQEQSTAQAVANSEKRQIRADAEQALLDSYQTELRIDGMIVSGTPGQVNTIKEASPTIGNVDVSATQQTSESVRTAPKADATAQAASTVDPSTWLPSSGRVITASSSAGGRYVEQQMIWSNVSGFGSESTYEPDFFLNNYPTSSLPGTYLDRSEELGRIPVAYATSNLPSAYLDTRIGDGPDEVVYTVGSAKANAIKVGVTYYTYIRTKDGDASQDNGKLQGQLGHRFPKSCYGTGCSWGDQIEPIVPGWQVAVPGTLNWPFVGPAAHFTMSAQGKTVNDGGTLGLSVPVNGNVTVNFASTSSSGSAPITNYLWKSNGSQICGNSSNCNYNFGTASNQITLTVTDSNGKTSTATGQVNLTFTTIGPTAHFTMSAQGKTASDGGTLNLSVPINGNVTVNFASTSTQGSATITGYLWKSNGTQICGNSSSCSYNFGTASNQIALTVTDSNGKTSTATGQVNLTFTTVGPTAHFTMSAQGKTATDGQTLTLSVPVNGNVTVAFNSNSAQGSAPITGYLWKSNGTQICGNSSTCSYNFGTASNQITLTVTDSNGKTSTATGQLNLTFTSTGPTAHFTMSAQGKTATDGQALTLSVPVNGNVTVAFNSTSVQGSAPITNYIWRSNGAQICGISSTCSYNFGTASNTITLTVTDSNGKTSTATGQLNLTFTSTGPTAHFTMSAQSKTANDGGTLNLSVPINGNVTVAFNSTSSAGSAPITSYVWRSNGTQICGNSSTCSYNFGTASNTITLTVTDSNGKTSTATGQVNLTFTTTGPTAHFRMSAQGKTANDGQTLTLSVPVNGNVTVAFSSTSSAGSAPITNYVWRSNGTQICGNSSTCSYNFGTPSNQITLTVADSNGKTSTATGQLNLTFY